MFSQSKIEIILEAFIYEKNKIVSDNTKYFYYINKMAAVNLSNISEQDIKLISDFLNKWGHMQRTGKKPDEKMCPVIKKNSQFLDQIKRNDLHSSNIQKYRTNIIDLFEELNQLVGHISATKILHLICPRFFPLWDNGIISAYNNSYKQKYDRELITMVKVQNTKNSKRATGEGYYNFMEFIKKLINNYIETFSQIQTTLNRSNNSKSLVRIVDDFHIFTIRTPYHYLV